MKTDFCGSAEIQNNNSCGKDKNVHNMCNIHNMCILALKKSGGCFVVMWGVFCSDLGGVL